MTVTVGWEKPHPSRGKWEKGVTSEAYWHILAGFLSSLLHFTTISAPLHFAHLLFLMNLCQLEGKIGGVNSSREKPAQNARAKMKIKRL